MLTVLDDDKKHDLEDRFHGLFENQWLEVSGWDFRVIRHNNKGYRRAIQARFLRSRVEAPLMG